MAVEEQPFRLEAHTAQYDLRAYAGSERRFRAVRDALLSAPEQDGRQATGEPLFARFNSPFQFGFLRCNEIWVEVEP